MKTNNEHILPAAPQTRIASLDLLRGFAVLGILIMNIQSFSMINAAYMNPAAYGDLTGINKWVWIFSNVLAAEKFLSIFSILFGAGIVLFTARAAEKNRKAGSLHYRRMWWLLLFGMLHAYLIWHGDILVAYSICGMLAYNFRNTSPKKLLMYSAIFFLLPVVFSVGSGFSIKLWPDEAIEQNMESWKPATESVEKENMAMRGGWLEQMKYRAKHAAFMQTMAFFWYTFWRAISMMLLGMALFKKGVLSAEKSNAYYLRMVYIGLTTGIALSGWGVYENFQHNWSMEFSMFFGNQFNYVGSIFTALGYIGLVMLFAKSNFGKAIKHVFSSVGKMAFTNYILMSVMAMFIFYGSGLGLFGEVDRLGQLLIIFAIWVILIILSPLWLTYFRFGPLEWLWRVLTYGKIQSMKKSK